MLSLSTSRTDGKLPAYTLPMAVFIGFLALVSLVRLAGSAAFALREPQYWVFPVQTLVCGGLLLWFWRRYEFAGVRQVFFVGAVGTLVFLLWISPQAFLGFAPRLEGFNPDVFPPRSGIWWSSVLLRFLRLVVVVPLVEEIFWRGFLLRYFIDEKFDRVAFGSFSWLSFAVVTGGFTLAHSTADWIPAAITGALYNFVAYRTKSLGSCVLAHALTNLLLGLWIMHTGQWGFW